jgi:hypothetical protein
VTSVVRFLAPLILFSGILPAADVAILVDVSGTMASYGAWQEDASALLDAVVNGRQPSLQQWRSAGDLKALPSFADAGSLHFVRFGSTQSASFPFFGEPQKLNAASLAAAFPKSRADYQQPRTNKPLAVAVGANLASGGAAGTARVIVISDFLVDSDLTNDQQTYVNDFESRAQVETPLILSWARDNHVQIKFLRIGIAGVAPDDKEPASASVQLLAARVLEDPRRVQFAWKVNGAAARHYSLQVRDAATRNLVFARNNVLSNSVLYPNPKAGRFHWQVTATLENGALVASPAAIVQVPGSGPWAWIGLLGALGAVGYGAWYYSKRKRHPSAMASAKGESKWKP